MFGEIIIQGFKLSVYLHDLEDESAHSVHYFDT